MRNRLFAEQDLGTFEGADGESYLKFLEEQPFERWAKRNKLTEAYRFTFIPTLDSPQVLKLWESSKASPPYHALYKLGRTQEHQQEGGIEHLASWELSEHQWTELKAAMEQNFWIPPSWKPEDKKEGALWIFEGYRDRQYKYLVSWSGRNPRACTLGRTFRELIPEYLGDELLCFRSLVGDELGAIVYEHIAAGRYIQALKIAQSHKSDYIKILALESSRIYESWGELSLEAKLLLLVQGVETAYTIENPQSQSPILRELALKYAALGQLNRSRQVAQQIPIAYYKVIVLDYLCDRYTVAGRLEEVASIRMELLLAAQTIKGDPRIRQLAPIIIKHARQERLNSKVGRMLKSLLARQKENG
ncbi:hypothetical protein [Oscillatoria sp. FACHB-1406]|uniref:hypothetical protein n=1 Tax=Oscillatoria sp. FACHB-1406 TaxID=2692846 RepID=UPI0016874F53|nr:hypothetical protein [Oscillatoria sp. FACHB-1406]MBD2577694.1 hypothetical protein [Oscillatoria sp. FACHB-1406]